MGVPMKNKISGFDIIGSRDKAVAIIEIPDELKSNGKKIAEEIMYRHKNVKSVLNKISEREGVFRTRKYKILAGDNNTEVLHKESGCKFRLDPMKVYFSEREGTERLRLSEQVKSGETIMLMFAGIGPYGIVILKSHLTIKIISIELNPDAFEYMKENIRINKMSDRMVPILGDVREKSKVWHGKCDRVIMPLPHDSVEFLSIAYKCLNPKGGTIHLYIIEGEESVKEKAEKIISGLTKKTKGKIKFNIRKVLPYSPRTNKYCLDIELEK